MEILIIKENMPLAKVRNLAQEGFGDMIKAVVDIEEGIMALGGELHADAEAILLNAGSLQKNLWGINIYPEKSGEDFVRYASMINIRPGQGNNSREIQIPEIKEKIINILHTLITS